MKISILNHDLSNNSLGRAYILAKMLSKNYDVEILGPKSTNNIWKPVSFDKDIKYVVLSSFFKDFQSNLKKIDGEIIYAIKPYASSYGYAILKKLFQNKKIILDEDDWDFGFFLDQALKYPIIDLLYVDLFNINNPLYVYLLGKLSFLADGITVSSTFLQKKFGGTIIPHARDINSFKIEKKISNDMKSKYNPDNKKVIMFYGTVRKHKGIDTIIKAIDLLNRDDILFILVGVEDKQNEFLPNKTYIKTIPPRPFNKLGEILSIADLIILPQKKSPSALAQVPAKIFDAMALSKPIIASNISDFPIILKDCGLIFEIDNIIDLAEKIAYIFDNPRIAQQMGMKAREKFIRNYSFDAVENKLFTIIETISKK